MNIIKVSAISKKYKGAFLSFGQFEEILLEFQKMPKEHKNEVMRFRKYLTGFIWLIFIFTSFYYCRNSINFFAEIYYNFF